MGIPQIANLEVGQNLKVKGERGEFKFRSAQFKDGVCVSVCVIGGTLNHSSFRHFAPERIVAKGNSSQAKKGLDQETV